MWVVMTFWPRAMFIKQSNRCHKTQFNFIVVLFAIREKTFSVKNNATTKDEKQLRNNGAHKI